MFDLTTTAQWRGPAVGVVRVEQELASRARHYFGDDVAFGLYDRPHSALLVIDNTVAEDLIAGRVRVDFTVPPSPARQGRLNKARRRLRAVLLRNATAYHIFQKLRGRSFTRGQILQFQAAARAEVSPPPLSSSTALPRRADEGNVPLAELSHYPARLDKDTTIISGGLDWEYKDLRVLWALKQIYGFSYCAIVYDLIPIRFPQFVIPSYTELLTDYFGELLWLADQAMCISQSIRQDWLQYAQEVGAAPVPSEVFPLGCDVPSGDPQNVELPSQLRDKRFALFVSTLEPRKNHRVLYEAWDECLRTNQVDLARDRLVFVGRRGWAVEDLLREIATNPLTRDTIVLLHEVCDEQLAMLYRRCAFVLFPSMYEGFGLPLVEALGYGKLCVSSSAGALSEVGGDLVMRLDPKDTLAWSRTISHLLSCPAECEAWEERIRRHYQPTTWDNAAKSFFNSVSLFSNTKS